MIKQSELSKTENKEKVLSSCYEYEKELTRVYNRFNKHFWNNELPDVVITILPSKSTYGHITVNPIWVDKTGDDSVKKYELNISADTIDRSPKELCETLLHEQVHLYCIIHEIQDTSNNGRYHNRNFKQVAEEHGYIIKELTSRTIGWSHGEFSASAYAYFKRLNVKQFLLHREETTSSTALIKYECPKCKKTKCWCSKKYIIICGVCNVPLVDKTPERRAKKEVVVHQ